MCVGLLWFGFCGEKVVLVVVEVLVSVVGW